MFVRVPQARLLKAWGDRVLRFWNHEVFQDPEAVVTEIQRVLLETSASRSRTREPRSAHPTGGGRRRLPARGE